MRSTSKRFFKMWELFQCLLAWVAILSRSINILTFFPIPLLQRFWFQRGYRKNSSSNQSVSHSCHALSWKRPHQSHDEFLQTNSFKKRLCTRHFCCYWRMAWLHQLRFSSWQQHKPCNNTKRYTVWAWSRQRISWLLWSCYDRIEAPFEQILDQLHLPVTAIITDAILLWTICCGNSRNIPVATLWTD